MGRADTALRKTSHVDAPDSGGPRRADRPHRVELSLRASLPAVALHERVVVRSQRPRGVRARTSNTVWSGVRGSSAGLRTMALASRHPGQRRRLCSVSVTPARPVAGRRWVRRDARPVSGRRYHRPAVLEDNIRRRRRTRLELAAWRLCHPPMGRLSAGKQQA
jgi:hypothetical protein